MNKHTEQIRCMKELAIFSTLDFGEREKIGTLAEKKLYRKHDYIFREDEPRPQCRGIKGFS